MCFFQLTPQRWGGMALGCTHTYTWLDTSSPEAERGQEIRSGYKTAKPNLGGVLPEAVTLLTVFYHLGSWVFKGLRL